MTIELTGLRKIYLFIAIFLSISVSAQNTDRQETDSMRNAFMLYRDSASTEFEAYKQNALEEYRKYLEQARADYQIWHNSIRQTWGKEDGIASESTKTVWVEYSRDKNNRSIVDFDKGNIIVEVLIPEDGNDADMNEKLTKAIERMLNSRGSTCPYPSSVDKSEPLTVDPILEGLINLCGYEIDEDAGQENQTIAPPAPKVKGKSLQPGEKQTVKPTVKEPQENKGDLPTRKKENDRKKKSRKNASIAKAIAQQSEKTVKNIVGDDGKTRKVAQVQIAMVSDNLSKNAALYKDIVAECSERFNIEQPLIYAVMEQESRFNPEAVSPANACGLMQLVATSGGTDAYKYVYGKTWIPTRSYLFNPRNNIELGTAYLRVLTNQFGLVADEDCRRLCVIAGYNTGAGNVSRAFTGKANVNTAIPHINAHNYHSLYNHLTTNLNTAEARNYVAGVSKRREKYLNP